MWYALFKVWRFKIRVQESELHIHQVYSNSRPRFLFPLETMTL